MGKARLHKGLSLVMAATLAVTSGMSAVPTVAGATTVITASDPNFEDGLQSPLDLCNAAQTAAEFRAGFDQLPIDLGEKTFG
ncbi:hypothetical protein [Tumebacillus permanentifrigoris]|uniref:Uncharacterized protein n=1 Tax=Tumebacillus permanentifrigoris TaxID=378543 RepID=A0A316D6K6_9BACL|nr:hypothetical protein [Tumebacillus permanentifrigoris]PWK10224.1 hypothetical protein C7459_11245 [Tumebacillus permanentifrigoris]